MNQTIILPLQNYRQYTESEPNDSYNILNGRCPDYALSWGIEKNKCHWPSNHNFLEGNNKNLPAHATKHEVVLRNILNNRFRTNNNQPIIYIEIDNILADLNKGSSELLMNQSNSGISYPAESYPPDMLLRIIQKTPNFYVTLDWTSNGKQLWEKIKKYKPIILTRVGKPSGSYIEEDKRAWCAINLGVDIQVITTTSKEKQKYCINNSILIDTNSALKTQWEISNGKFIHFNLDNDYNNHEELASIIDSHMMEVKI